MPLVADVNVLVETLSTITEFSIGLAGFSGVAAALMQRSGSISELDRMRITVNVCLSLIPGFVAFLTLALINAGLDLPTVVRFASGAIVVVYLATFPLPPIIRKKAGGFQRFNPFALGIMFLSTLINLPLQSYNWIAMPESASGILIAGLSMFLLAGAANFAGLLWQMLGYDAVEDGPAQG
jgi:hypothetical protein